MIRLTDASPIGQVKRTTEGYISAVARSIRSGVQEYGAWENDQWLAMAEAVGKTATDTVSVYRPPESVFSKDSLKSAVHIPVTLGHPAELVDSSNWADYAVGEVGSDVLRDGEFVAFSLMIKDKKGTDAYDAGTVELSAGYLAEMTIAGDESPYDYIMGPPVFNHLALVQKARAGSAARIGDAQWGASPVIVEDKKMTVELKTVILGDKAVQVEAKDADTVAAILKDHKTALDALQAANGALEVKLADALAKVLTDAQIAALVSAKVKVDTERAAVMAKLGDKAKDWSDSQIEGAFLALDGIGDDTMRTVIKDQKPIEDADAKIAAAQKKFLNPEAK